MLHQRTFASDYPRSKEGWIRFPFDDSLRKQLFPATREHPARANLYMLLEIIKWVSRPGELILDPMAGSGGLMVATAVDRRVVCIDVEEAFYQYMQAASIIAPELVTILHGDCRKLLPIPVDHIIFSPPYATALRRDEEAKTVADKTLAKGFEYTTYSQSKDNIGRLNQFMYGQAMEKVYRLCYESLPKAGSMTIIIKDNVLGGKRQPLTDWAIRCCVRCGFQVREWFKRESLGSGYLKLRRSRGEYTVTDEDIVVMDKL